jgi:two-component system sensor histidine kinase KdpD
MTADHRPNPDSLLASMQREESKKRRGRLKIFFGMAPGVGKTYAMLQDAHREQADGVDVVIGYIETHGRSETAALTENLVAAPRRTTSYRDVTLEEMDLDAIVFLRPQLVLVDELAHTNAPDSRHPKRYQDVLELLSLGIDVSTTLNVQHIESRAEAVRQITGVAIQETVPDSLLEMADEVVLIDITPERLRERLNEGKVYLGPRAGVAADNFFKETNLTALRELALRLTAERVDHRLRELRQGQTTPLAETSGGRLLVAVGPSPHAAQLIRSTRRLAYSQGAPWMALAVETSRPLAAEAQRQLDKNLSLARELGAEVALTHDDDIVAAILRTARQNNVGQVVTGKPLAPRIFDWLRGGSVVDRLIRQSENIHILVVSPDPLPGTRRWNYWALLAPSPFREYFLAVITVSVLTVLNELLVQVTGYSALALVYLLGVVLLGLFVGLGPVLVAAGLSATLWDYLFIPPRFTFYISRPEDVLMLAIFFVVALVTGQLTSRIRRQERNERKREQRSLALYRLSRTISSSSTIQTLIASSLGEVQRLFECEACMTLTNSEFGLSTQPQLCSTLSLDEKEHSVAVWASRNRRAAGRFTDTLPSAEAFHVPLVSGTRSLGVISVKPKLGALTLDQRDLLESFASQLAVVLEKEKLREEAASARDLSRSNELQRNLLNSVSHELRTPLAVIQTAVEQLKGRPTSSPQLLDEASVAVDRLNRLVRNLLDSARLEAGQLAAKREWGLVSELLEESVALVQPTFSSGRLTIKCSPELLVRTDFALLSQALANILHNAAIYTPADKPIVLSAEGSKTVVIIRVTDKGPGLSPEVAPHIFDKFFRPSNALPGGAGLGLSISRGFVEAVGGTLEAFNQPEGGAAFVIKLPLESLPDGDQLAS